MKISMSQLKVLDLIFTNGLNRYKGIGVDLLPHALSLLIELLGNHKIENLKIGDIQPNRFFAILDMINLTLSLILENLKSQKGIFF